MPGGYKCFDEQEVKDMQIAKQSVENPCRMWLGILSNRMTLCPPYIWTVYYSNTG
jgi:hypothetical protein